MRPSSAGFGATVGSRHQPPARSAGTLTRPRLIERLDLATRRHRVTVVAAPGGYGKTTAVASWALTRPGAIAWLALTPFDRDRDSLDIAVVETLQRHLRGAPGSAADRLLDLDAEAEHDAVAYRTIRRAVEALAEPVHLVVDDAQRAQEALTTGLLGALIESAPPNLRIIVVGTTALETLAARAVTDEPDALIGADALRFTATEVRSLLDQEGVSLSTDDVLSHSQGWPVAVRLMVLGRTAPAPGAEEQDPERRLRDYVEHHILPSLPRDLVAFILDATVCTELTGSVAVAVTGRADAVDQLERCVALGLFLDRFAAGPVPTYRWHAIFARQCQSLRAATDPTAIARLHAAAGKALRATQTLTAVEHLLDAGDAPLAREVLLQHWLRLVLGVEASALDQICLRFPGAGEDDPDLLLVRACALDVLGQHTMSRTLYRRATAIMDAREPVGSTAEVRALADLFLLDDRDAVFRASAHMRRLIESSPGLRNADHASVLYLIGWAELRHRMSTDVVAEFLAAAAAEARAAGNAVLERRALDHLVLAHAWAGRMDRARATLARLDGAEDDPSSPWAYYANGGRFIGDGWVSYWAGDLERAYDCFSRALHSGSSRLSFGGLARLMLAASAAGTRDPRRCRRAAAELDSMLVEEAQGVVWSIFRDAAVAVLSEAAGHRERAVAVARRHLDTANVPFIGVVLAGILRRSGELTGALQILQNQRAYANVSYVAVAIRLTSALAQTRRGDTAAAHELCEAALDSGAAQGIVLPFCDGDLAVRQLLAAHVVRRTAHERFIADCLAGGGESGVFDQLSDREGAVFALLQTAKTLGEIGVDLGVSVNTVKSHQRSIYRKLGVTSRREVRQIVP